MQFFTIAFVALAAFSSVVVAQDAGTASSTTHLISVGGGGQLVYTPNTITAAVGDKVSFQFLDKNHTATQSTFAAPCLRLKNDTATGFDSDFRPVAAQAEKVPIWTIEIQSTDPIWVFCKQGKHCQAGMVLSINAATSGPKTFEAFLAAAKAGGLGANDTATNGTDTNGTDAGNGTVTDGTSGATTTRGPGSTVATLSLTLLVAAFTALFA